MMTLDHLRRITFDRHTLNHVRIQSALCEKPVTAVFARAVPSVLLKQLLGRMLKRFDKFIADQLSLGFGVDYPFEQREKALARVNVFQTYVEIWSIKRMRVFFTP